MPFIQGGDQSVLAFFANFDTSPPTEVSASNENTVYFSITRRVDLSTLTGTAAAVRAILLSSGATHFRVRYDGGDDEGAVHPDALRFDGHFQGVQECVERLRTPATVNALTLAGTGDRCAPITDSDLILAAIDQLAYKLMFRLVDGDWCTGPFGIFGAFVADLQTGDLVDDPNAQKSDEEKY